MITTHASYRILHRVGVIDTYRFIHNLFASGLFLLETRKRFRVTDGRYTAVASDEGNVYVIVTVMRASSNEALFVSRREKWNNQSRTLIDAIDMRELLILTTREHSKKQSMMYGKEERIVR